MVIFCDGIEEQIKVKELFALLQSESGLTINESKTMWMPYSNSSTVGIYKSVDSFSYLGTRINREGDVVSNDIIDKFKSKVDLVANLMNLNSSLEFHMRLINIYCLPVLYHVLHADFDVYDIWEDVYKHICKVIGFRCRRVGLDRMFMSLNNGGYGLINLVDIDCSSKLSWINYVVDNIDNKFSDFISGWNEYTKKKANTVVGPLMSWNNMNGESNYLQNISRKWKKIRFYNNFVGKVASWNDNDGSN